MCKVMCIHVHLKETKYQQQKERNKHSWHIRTPVVDSGDESSCVLWESSFLFLDDDWKEALFHLVFVLPEEDGANNCFSVIVCDKLLDWIAWPQLLTPFFLKDIKHITETEQWERTSLLAVYMEMFFSHNSDSDMESDSKRKNQEPMWFSCTCLRGSQNQSENQHEEYHKPHADHGHLQFSNKNRSSACR